MQTISQIACSESEYVKLRSITNAYIQAANDVLGVGHFSHTVVNSDGRLFAGGEVEPDVFQFVDLDDPERTVYTLAELKALDTKQDWIAI